MPQLVHLHNHTDYSLLDGAQSVDSMVKRAKEFGMPAVAITEHGNVFSIIEFYKVAKKYDIKPIFGSELYITEDRFDKRPKSQGGYGYHHLVLLAMNIQGYKNLTKLASYGYLEGFYYKPRIDFELLEKYNEGLICATACIQGSVQQAFLKEGYEKAKLEAQRYMKIFPDRFYLEVQNHGIPEEAEWREAAKKLGEELNLPRIATNDAHYTFKEDYDAHDAALCIGTNKFITDTERMRYDHHYWFKSPDEMEELFPNDPEVFENTLKIAEQCNVEFTLGEEYHLPVFPIPDDVKEKNPDDYLAKLVFDGLEKRYPEITDEIRERAEYELKVVKDMGFAGYFLIVQDFVRYAKQNNIPVGPGRGSAAGSIICYATEITDIDPLRFDLIFERFLNPNRVSMPDIDIDFCDERRGEVIDHIKNLYGHESVCQITTFGKMKAKAVIRDVGRVMQIPLPEVNRIAKLIPDNTKLPEALEKVPELKEASEMDKQHRELFEMSLVLEGLHRHSSVHAAGVVIAPGDLTDYVPVYTQGSGDAANVTTQYDMKCIDDIGLLKVDFLGLRNLSVIKNTLKLLKHKNIEVDFENIPEDDEATFRLFGEGKTVGVFQFESSGMREYLKKLQPSQVEDLIAMNALYRPGPMENIEEFIARKHGKKEIVYMHPTLEPILKNTYGIIVYQEQVMQIGQVIGGFSLGKADEMRRAMGKKKMEVLEGMRKEFVDGAEAQGIKAKLATEIYDLVFKFASYGFNKSHAAAYAVLAYKIGYLKAHYPAEFMAANMTSEISNTDRIVILANEINKIDLKLLPPDVNKSFAAFSTEDGNIRYGLNGIKNMGAKAAESIVDTRLKKGEFEGSFYQFVSDLDLKNINKKAIECLVQAGALDSLDGTRAQKFHAIETAFQYAQKVQAERATKQANLFGGDSSGGGVILEPRLPDVPGWDSVEELNREKDLTGLFLNGHPLMKYEDEIETFSTYDFSIPLEELDKSTVKLGGIVTNISLKFDRKGRRFAFFSLETMKGTIEVLAFADVYEKYNANITTDFPVFLTGKVSCRNGEDAKILANEIVPLQGMMDRSAQKLHIKFNTANTEKTHIDELKRLVDENHGDCELFIHLFDKRNKNTIRANDMKVGVEKSFLKTLRQQFGEQNIWVE